MRFGFWKAICLLDFISPRLFIKRLETFEDGGFSWDMGSTFYTSPMGAGEKQEGAE